MHTDDSVSTLWTSLLDKELTRVRSNPQLAARLLRKPISSHSVVIDGLAKNACSIPAAATYFQTVLEFPHHSVSEFTRAVTLHWITISVLIRQFFLSLQLDLCTPMIQSLAARLLRKPISSHSVVIDGLAKNACSIPAAATYFQTVLDGCSKYPGFSTGLQVLNIPSKGRHVIATDEFEPGDVLAVEPAGGWSTAATHHNYSAQADNFRSISCPPTTEHLILLPSQRTTKCAACLTTLSAVGFVCPRCCDAAYCAPPSKCFTAHLVGNDQSSQNLTYCQPPWHNVECR
ncbi:hypothetical protein AHF37_10842 [Paragonimus kellicotti]|nr:hypothetical protein AHF37_10842 [Paragonimus kellicotti]